MLPVPAVLILVISIVALPHIDSKILSRCMTNSDCPSGFCCALGPLMDAACMPFQQKDEQCRGNADTITTNLSYPNNTQIEVKRTHYILCPCANGLSCDSQFGFCR